MNIRWNQVAIAVAAGFLMGAFFSDYYHMHLKRRPPRSASAGSPVEMISNELHLSGPQKDAVSAVFEKYRPKIKKVKDTVNPELEKLRVQLKAELKPLLTPEQYGKLEKLDNDSKHPGGGPTLGEQPSDRPGGERPPR